MVAFRVFDDDIVIGGSKTITQWWDHEVEVIFRFLDPSDELAALARAGMKFVARLDRGPHIGVEHQSHRSYLLVRRPR